MWQPLCPFLKGTCRLWRNPGYANKICHHSLGWISELYNKLDTALSLGRVNVDNYLSTLTVALSERLSLGWFYELASKCDSVQHCFICIKIICWQTSEPKSHKLDWHLRLIIVLWGCHSVGLCLLLKWCAVLNSARVVQRRQIKSLSHTFGN